MRMPSFVEEDCNPGRDQVSLFPAQAGERAGERGDGIN